MSSIGSTAKQLRRNARASQRTFQGVFKAILAESLTAKRMMNTERVAKRLKRPLSYNIRILGSCKFVR